MSMERSVFRGLLARAIVRHRDRYGQISSTSELVDIIRGALPAKVQRRMGKHPARRVFSSASNCRERRVKCVKNGIGEKRRMRAKRRHYRGP